MNQTPPRRLGAYRITGPLGQGGMGTVHAAWDDRRDRPVAIKWIRPDRAKDRRAQQRFRGEALALASLTHPAIVQLFDVVETDRGDALVLERIHGETLRQRMERRPLTIPEAIGVTRQLASGLVEVHRRALVHRDLKAENVMIAGEDGEIRATILDFGVAKSLTDPRPLREHGTAVGSSLAMSPEQALGLDLDHRSDLFSLGCLLYQMVTGHPPFAGQSVAETLGNICTLHQVPAAELSPEASNELSELIDRLLAKDPSRRPPSSTEVIAALDRLSASPLGSRDPRGSPTLDDRGSGILDQTTFESEPVHRSA